jgi:type IV secretory pathway TrbD component
MQVMFLSELLVKGYLCVYIYILCMTKWYEEGKGVVLWTVSEEGGGVGLFMYVCMFRLKFQMCGYIYL